MAIQNSFSSSKMDEIYKRNPSWAPQGYQAPYTPKVLTSDQRNASFTPGQLTASQNRLGITPTQQQPTQNTNNNWLSGNSMGMLSGEQESIDHYNNLARKYGLDPNTTEGQNLIAALKQTSKEAQTSFGQPGTGTTQTVTPNSAQVTGGIDFSNLQPQFNWSIGSSTNNQNSYSGLSREGMNALLPLLSNGASGLSNRIDQWADQAASKYYTKGSDIIDMMNQVANKRAQSGILGGTEAQNLRANMLGQLLDRTLGEQAKLYSQGLNLKASTVPQLLSLLQQSTSTGTAQSNNMSYGQSPQDYQIIADMIRAGWTG